MFPQVNGFKDFHEGDYEINELSKVCERSELFKDQLNQATTKNSPTLGQKLLKGQQSLSSYLTGDSCSEFSFIGNEISQHESTFKNSIQKYIETIYQCQQNHQKIFFNNEFYQEQITNISQIKIQKIINDNSLLIIQQKDKFIYDIVNKKSLEKFLKMIYLKISQQMGNQILMISHMVWQYYLNIKKQQKNLPTILPSFDRFVYINQDFTQFVKDPCVINYDNNLFDQEDIKFYSQKFVSEKFQEITNNYYLKCLTMRQDKPKPIASYEIFTKAFKEFLECFTQTIMLIAEGHFTNPNFSNQIGSPKRSFQSYKSGQSIYHFNDEYYSDEEDDYQNTPKKKIK